MRKFIGTSFIRKNLKQVLFLFGTHMSWRNKSEASHPYKNGPQLHCQS